MKLRAGIRLTTVTVFALVTLAVALIAISLQYYFGQQLAREVAEEEYLRASHSVVTQLASMEAQSANSLRLISELPSLTEPNLEVGNRQYLRQLLLNNPFFYGVYIGKDDGYFYELINLETSQEARNGLKAHPSDRWVEIRVQRQQGERVRQFQYYDSDFNLRFERSESTDYDPRQRSWYQQAQSRQDLYQTPPYLFAQLQVPGMTLSIPLRDKTSVLGVDLLLTTLSGFLQQQGFGQQRGHAYIFQDDGDIIASSQDSVLNTTHQLPALPMSDKEKAWVKQQDVLQVSNELNWPPVDFALGGQPRGYSIDMLKMIANVTGLEMNFVNGLSWQQLVDNFQAGELDILHSVFLTDNNQHWGQPSLPYAQLPFALASREQSYQLTDLQQQTLAIPAGWSIIPVIRQQYPDINIVESESTLQALQWVQQGKATAALDNEAILRTLRNSYFLADILINSNIGLNHSQRLERLVMLTPSSKPQLSELLDRAISHVQSHAQQQLARRWLRPQAQLQGNLVSSSIPTPVFLTLAKDQDTSLVSVLHNESLHYAYVKSITTPDAQQNRYFGVLVPQQIVHAPFMQQVKVSIAVSAALLALILPLSWAFAYPIVRPVRELAAENEKIRQHQESHVKRIHSPIVELDQLSESIVNMVTTIKQQEQAQRDLLDAFIQLIAQAIDQKSPYTGGHCARVPELALLLVKAADESTTPAFNHFKVDGRDAWRELRIAAWLHDCGKVTTPEYVVDKATKLETIHNRIHEIRTRFEVLWRDAEIEYLRLCQQQPEQQPQWQQQRDLKQQRLRDDFAFIAECNIGGEFLDDRKKARLEQLAATTWQRHFDNRLGLSIAEQQRFTTPAQALPATEKLLHDGPEHIIEREHDISYLHELGITMEAPEYLYHRGELHNLSISRGTLTEEERFKINEHIIGTIRMLEALPFPPELAAVPRYASTHHERMDGKGYPRGLSAEQLSIPERMLAVADVFEALTASDRPYKPGKTLSQTLKILSSMVKDHHLDSDAFELLLTSGLYLRYAQKYLRPEQIDEVNINDYLQVEKPQCTSSSPA